MTIVLKNIPDVTPFTMTEAGQAAHKAARLATLQALHRGHLQQIEFHHWVLIVDGDQIGKKIYYTFILYYKRIILLFRIRELFMSNN